MKPAAFEYLRAGNLEEALDLLSEWGDSAKVLAGGQSLVPAMSFRLAAAALLIDINRVTELDLVEPSRDGGLRIGAMTRQRRLEREALVFERAPLLAETVPFVAHPQIRNRGTVGGSLAHADPAAELPAVMVTLDARFRLARRGSDRWVAARDFFTGLFATVLEPEELLVEIEIPAAPTRTGWAFQEISRRLGDYAMAGLASRLELDENGRCASGKLVAMSVGDGPVLLEAAAMLAGELPSAELFAAVAAAAAAEVAPAGDIHATAEYRRHLVGVLTRRCLGVAARRAEEGNRGSGSGIRSERLTSAPVRSAPAHSGPRIPAPGSPVPDSTPGSRQRVSTIVNGRPHDLELEPRELLSDVLRHGLGLTGTHVGCEHGVCGACTVLVDGEAVRSCLLLGTQADGCEISTVEGLSPDGGVTLHPLQEAFRDSHGLQCGFCTPGFLMTLVPYLAEHPDPTEAEVRHALSGNLCRCTGYQHIVDAVLLAAKRAREAGGGAET